MVKTLSQLISRSRPEFPNETLRTSWDILQAIHRNFKLLPHFILFHVCGDQDNLSDSNDVLFSAQLNIQADFLVTTNKPTHPTDQGPMISGTGCHLLVENQFIQSYHGNSVPNGVNANSCGISRRGTNCQLQMSHASIGTATLGQSISFNTNVVPS